MSDSWQCPLASEGTSHNGVSVCDMPLPCHIEQLRLCGHCRCMMLKHHYGICKQIAVNMSGMVITATFIAHDGFRVDG